MNCGPYWPKHFYFIPQDLLTIYITYIRPKIEHNYHLWARALKPILRFLDRKQVEERANSRAFNSIGDNMNDMRKVGYNPDERL